MSYPKNTRPNRECIAAFDKNIANLEYKSNGIIVTFDDGSMEFIRGEMLITKENKAIN